MDNEYQFDSDRPRDSWFKKEFTLANAITLGTILLAIGLAWARLDSKAENDHNQIVELKATNEKQVGQLQQSINTLTSTLVDTNLLVRELSTTVRLEGTRTRLENRQDR